MAAIYVLPIQISIEEMLRRFFSMHDPMPRAFTSTQYRSAIFYHDEVRVPALVALPPPSSVCSDYYLSLPFPFHLTTTARLNSLLPAPSPLRPARPPLWPRIPQLRRLARSTELKNTTSAFLPSKRADGLGLALQ
eukprot:scaffold272388_cov41-Tisochrysis_lutea.AAC.2